MTHHPENGGFQGGLIGLEVEKQSLVGLDWRDTIAEYPTSNSKRHSLLSKQPFLPLEERFLGLENSHPTTLC
ncbi:hypothetical protein COLO4_10885 [Corchorus olitorius]|uniref:Uncharacterized protein n=1 Tax=Corchorus olitorius TaxID=93759 RepID=A0A1R3K6M7_9ROSI|nr:hypothetical protein COLO4_10885 [Corchorus olitorius]